MSDYPYADRARRRWEHPGTPAARRRWERGPDFRGLIAAVAARCSTPAPGDALAELARNLQVADAVAELEDECRWAAINDPEAQAVDAARGWAAEWEARNDR